MTNSKAEEFEFIALEAYRFLVCGQTGKAQETLAEVYQQLLTFTELLPADKVQFLAKLFTVMHNAQEKNDLIYLADILRFEVLTLIKVHFADG
tara:strand:- start:898 stop:1176 length:279 start_codon:yes stop_codon:yes gene_type:complete